MTAAPGPAADARSVARALALARAARRLAAAGRGRAALAATRGIGLPRLRGATLAGIAPLLGAGLPAAALAQARGLPDAWARAAALAGLLPHLPAHQRPRATGDLLAAAGALDWLAGDLVLRDAALALSRAGDPEAGRLLAGIRDPALRRPAPAAGAGDPARSAQETRWPAGGTPPLAQAA